MRMYLLELKFFRSLEQHKTSVSIGPMTLSYPLQSYSENQHVIITHMRTYVRIWTKEEMHINEKKKKT